MVTKYGTQGIKVRYSWFVNEGIASSLDNVTIPVSGIYYMVVTIDTICNQVTLWLQVNKETAFEIQNNLENDSQRVTRGKGVVIRLTVNDLLTVYNPNATIRCSRLDSNIIYSFFGVLLSPDNI